ncbi:bacillithiol system redox-active protein YtxJ [Halobacillus rhizosphaerae]|uniref:bacillithiol system redox-active protein YtxJ n=1 Tax=Halobacillus rhizosphaerae TaxID=3064889 RepID=UPI00398B0ADF
MDLNIVQSEEELEAELDQGAFFLLKHSLTCPISAQAKSEYEKFSKQSDFPCCILNIQQSRDLSNKIAERFNVKHESPQVLLFQNQQVTWHESHFSITADQLHNRL